MIVPNVVTRPPALQPVRSGFTTNEILYDGKIVNTKTKVRSPQSTLGKGALYYWLLLLLLLLLLRLPRLLLLHARTHQLSRRFY